MYSEELEALFKNKKLKVGDLLHIKNNNNELNGILMPRPDTGDDSIIIIKLDNGYNIGIKYSKDIEVNKKESKTQENFTFPKATSKNNKDLEKITLLYTGGTIGSKVDYVTGGVYMLTKPEELLYEVPELSDIANINVEQLMSVASEDMSYKEWQLMAKHVADALNEGAKGVVITHGTDTMHYTSAALSFMLQNLNSPVVLTGAQRSSDRGSSDAFMNLICSARIASKTNINKVGICMHSNSSDKYCDFILGSKARKMHTSSRDAFKSINTGILARAYYEGNVEEYYKNEFKAHKEKVVAKTGYESKIAMVISYPNSDPGVIEYYSKKNYKGLILQGTGLGHAPVSTSHNEYNWTKAIKDGVSSGMIIGMTSQCINGRVNGNVYRNGRLIQEAGAIYCEDMLAETAYVKLGFLLGNYSKKDAEKLLAKNLVGEITERTTIS
ncbi:MAG: Glu-tRNA(Gln) amidotransferase subunit GatD [Candidatus Micrarchaeia archaeon]